MSIGKSGLNLSSSRIDHDLAFPAGRSRAIGRTGVETGS
jgi:hypothetical protein